MSNVNNEYLETKRYYENNKDNIYIVVPDKFDAPLKCRMVCPYSDETYLFEYSENNVRQTVVAHDTQIYISLASANEAYEKHKSAGKKAITMTMNNFVYIVDPARFNLPIIGKITGKSKSNLFFVSYATKDNSYVAIVHASMLFQDFEAAKQRFSELKAELESLKEINK